jgi:hypothetical protein
VDTTSGDETPRDEAMKGDAARDGAPAAESAKQAPAERAARPTFSGQIEDLVAAVQRLEAFAADEAKRVSGKLVPQIESKAKQNIWMSLLLALGLGLILGVWLTGGRRRD